MSRRGSYSASEASGHDRTSDPDTPVVRRQHPQKTIEEFWDSFTTKYPGKVLRILPKNVHAKNKAAREPRGTVHGEDALRSYEEARAECIAAVTQISRECRRVNMRYRDPHFDIESDLKEGSRRCLDAIGGYDPNYSPRPRAVKRVPDIFKNPSFYVDGAAAADVRQGKTGDCYFLAAVGALGNKQGLIDRVCVARDEKVGVYGFCFHRDGEWMHTVIDDRLYLSIADYDESREEKSNWTEIMNRADAEQEYREAFQTGSRALYFAQCNDENETWLPLLEKAYAKAHGDYFSIIGGFTGEAIEDLTGGVTTELFGSDILDKDQFWHDELRHVGTKFLFGCATGRYDDWQGGGWMTERQGIVSTHAYTILRADSYKGERLLLVRNPWGEAEWTGRWSDGSPEWTAESIQALNHKFGDDGMFWISFEDLLRKYQFFDRTRLFDDSWKVSQQWAAVDVQWTADYNDTKFAITLTERSSVVIVLSQLDYRFFTGLEGQYEFTLHFRVDKDGEETYEVRSHGNYWMSRSVSTEVDLDAGKYNVFIKIKAKRDLSQPRVEEVVRRNCKRKPEKLLQVGFAYDLAHAKAVEPITEDCRRERVELKKRRKAKEEKALLKKARKIKYRKWEIEMREIERQRRVKARLEAHKKKAKEEQEAEKNHSTAPTTLDKATEAPSEPEKISNTSAGAALSNGTGADATNTTPASPGITKSSTNGDEGEWVVEGKPQDSTAAKLDAAIREPLRGDQNLTVPDTNAKAAGAPAAPLLSPPGSPGAPPSTVLRAASPAPSVRTIVSFDSSVDALLDLPLDPADLVSDSDASDDEAEDETPDKDNIEFANDPWNATCVVGLRVYNQRGNVSIAVVRPKSIDGEDDTPLDVDDPSKGVSDEVPSRMGSQILPTRPGGPSTQQLPPLVPPLISPHVITSQVLSPTVVFQPAKKSSMP